VERLAAWSRRYWPELLIAFAAVATVVQVLLADDGVRVPDLSPGLAAVLSALIVLPLLARRRLPFAAPLALWVLAAAFSFVDGELVTFALGVYAAGLASAFMLGTSRDLREGRIGLVTIIGCSAILMYNDPSDAPGDVVLLPAVFALAWVAGLVHRNRTVQAETAEQRAEHAERERETATRIAVAEERARIARELHDIVAHAMSVMVLQVGAVRHRLPRELAEEDEALHDVESTGRTALGEMRRLLGAIRSDGENAELAPQPGLDRLETLLDDVRKAGLRVELEVDGDPVALPHGIDVSAYRIVQEGLTNTLKHAHAREALVRIGYGGDELRIDVRDDGSGVASGDGLGHGLIGIRERVSIYGGEMTAATGGDGGFVLTTRLPITEAPA
jgi:signal transduction histidine kinase